MTESLLRYSTNLLMWFCNKKLDNPNGINKFWHGVLNSSGNATLKAKQGERGSTTE